jgi:hypothetical protein
VRRAGDWGKKGGGPLAGGTAWARGCGQTNGLEGVNGSGL